jgi:ADP-ribose pyrophosphatase YjhB (NUDIX family)
LRNIPKTHAIVRQNVQHSPAKRDTVQIFLIGKVRPMTIPTPLHTWSHWHQHAPRKSVAVGAVVRREDTFLLVRHAVGGLRGQWSFPTGFAEPGESPDRTAVRETHEEAGINVAVEGFLTLCNVDWEGDNQLYLVFLCQPIDGIPTADGIEIDAANYVPFDAFHTWSEPIIPFTFWLAQRLIRQDYQVLRPVLLTSLDSRLGTAFI